MAKRAILAVAGAGKTYYVCNTINPEKRNLILAFTHENIRNIRAELIKRFSCIPELTYIQTFESFLHQHCILPFTPSIRDHFQYYGPFGKGVSLVEPENLYQNGSRNYSYIKKENIGHYITRSGMLYCSRLAELALQTQLPPLNSRKRRLTQKISARLDLLFDNIYIDEFQDFRLNNYKLVADLSKHLATSNILVVGDFYQHSVSARSNHGTPITKDTTLNDYINILQRLKFDIDTDSLMHSRRCPQEVCDFVSKKLNISIKSANINKGRIVICDYWKAQGLLANDEILKLVWKDADKCDFRAMNWGYSKGSTFPSVCVILTKDTDAILDEGFDSHALPSSTRNKLYVALTRTKGDLYIIRNSIFKALCETKNDLSPSLFS